MAIKQTIKSIFSRYRSFFTNVYKARYKQVKATKGDLLVVNVRAYNAQGTIQAVLSTLMDYQLFAEIGDAVGKRGVEIIKEKLEPIKRTGQTAGSFDYKYDVASKTTTIFSDDEGAYYLYEGFGTSKMEALEEWMQQKSEFANLSAKETSRVAFAIRYAIANGQSPGANSDLSRMAPTGERRSIYPEEALQQLEGEMPSFLDDIVI